MAGQEHHFIRTRELYVEGGVEATPRINVTQSANADAVNIDNNGTASAINITQDGVLGASDPGVYLYSNAAQVNSLLLRVHNDNASSTHRTMEIENDGSGYGLEIDQNNAAGASALIIDSESASTAGLIVYSQVDGTAASTLNKFGFTSNAEADGGGGAIYAYSNQTSRQSNQPLVWIRDDNTAITQQTLEVESDAANVGILVDHNGATNYAIEIDRDSNDAATVYAMKIDSDNAGAGVGGGIDFSAMGQDEPLFKFVADAITNPGTLSHQAAVDVGGTIFYIPLYTHGS